MYSIIYFTSQIELLGELANKVELECSDPLLIITSGLIFNSWRRSLFNLALQGISFLIGVFEKGLRGSKDSLFDDFIR